MRLVYEYIIVFIIISILIMVIDAVLGEIAEFYNAWSWIISITKFIHGQNPPTDSYIINQEGFGDFAPLMGLLVLIIEAGIPTLIIVKIMHILIKKENNIRIIKFFQLL